MGWKWPYHSLSCSSSARIISHLFKSPKYPWDDEIQHENSITMFAEEYCIKTHLKGIAERCLIWWAVNSAFQVSWCLLSWKPYSKTNRMTTTSIGRPWSPTPPLYKWASAGLVGYTELSNTTQWTLYNTLSYPILHNELARESMLDH